MKSPFDTAMKREKAVKYQVSPVSIDKVLNGGVVRGLAGHRIRNGLQADGLAHLAPHLFQQQLGAASEAPGIAVDPEAEADKIAV